MSLLNWRAIPDRIPGILGCIMKTEGEDIVKFLQDVLDTLFSVFSTENGGSTPHSGLVFHVLVHILSILQESRYVRFQPGIDACIVCSVSLWPVGGCLREPLEDGMRTVFRWMSACYSTHLAGSLMPDGDGSPNADRVPEQHGLAVSFTAPGRACS